MRKLIGVLRLPWPDKRLLLETVALLALTRLAVLLLPFRCVARTLGKETAQTPEQEDAVHGRQIRRVAAMIRRTARHVPWTSKCLDQAVTARFMLARRGISTTTYFGVKNDTNGQLEAHAWLRSGTLYVTGGDTRSRFTIINSFADERP
jgi:hypothetical protein